MRSEITYVVSDFCVDLRSREVLTRLVNFDQSMKNREAVAGVTIEDFRTVMQHHDSITEALDLLRRMADENDRPPFTLKLADFVDTLELEQFVADREHLVNKQDVGIDMHGDGEREANVHP